MNTIKIFVFYCTSLLLACAAPKNTTVVQQASIPSIKDYGAKLDGVTDDADAVKKMLDAKGIAFIPFSPSGIRINKPITLKNGQKIHGEIRSMVIKSGVKSGEFLFNISDIPFAGYVEVSDFTVDVQNQDAGVVRINQCRQVHIKNFTILGNDKCDVGVLLDDEGKGSAWNYIEDYCIVKCKAAVKLTSKAKNPWCNRNYIGYGVAQSCGIGLWIEVGNTNSCYLNPQGCEIGIRLDNADSNFIQTFEEGSQTSIKIAEQSKNNKIGGEMSIETLEGVGKRNTFEVNQKKEEVLERKMSEPPGTAPAKEKKKKKD